MRHVKGASWQEDIGLAAEAILREENGPCVVFDEMPGCPKGFRVLLNMFAGVRRNMTLGFPDHLSKWELSDAFREAYLKDRSRSRTRSWTNGMFKGYEIYVSADDQDWGTPVATGEFPNSTAVQRIDFTAKPGRYVKLVGTSSLNGAVFGSAAELNVYGTH